MLAIVRNGSSLNRVRFEELGCDNEKRRGRYKVGERGVLMKLAHKGNGLVSEEDIEEGGERFLTGKRVLCILPDFHKVDQSVVMGIIEGWEKGPILD